MGKYVDITYPSLMIRILAMLNKKYRCTVNKSNNAYTKLIIKAKTGFVM